LADRSSPTYLTDRLGANLDGMLAEYAVFNEEAVVLLPSYLSFEEAATPPWLIGKKTPHGGHVRRGCATPKLRCSQTAAEIAGCCCTAACPGVPYHSIVIPAHNSATAEPVDGSPRAVSPFVNKLARRLASLSPRRQRLKCV
jgi:hypothetical protein